MEPHNAFIVFYHGTLNLFTWGKKCQNVCSLGSSFTVVQSKENSRHFLLYNIQIEDRRPKDL